MQRKVHALRTGGISASERKPEATRCRQPCQEAIDAVTVRLRRSPEDLAAAQNEVKREARVNALRGEELTYRRLVHECDQRQQTAAALPTAAQAAL